VCNCPIYSDTRWLRWVLRSVRKSICPKLLQCCSNAEVHHYKSCDFTMLCVLVGWNRDRKCTLQRLSGARRPPTCCVEFAGEGHHEPCVHWRWRQFDWSKLVSSGVEQPAWRACVHWYVFSAWTIYQLLSYACSARLCTHAFEPSLNLRPMLLTVAHFSTVTLLDFILLPPNWVWTIWSVLMIHDTRGQPILNPDSNTSGDMVHVG